MEQVTRQLQSMPVAAKHARLRGIDVGYKYVENSPRLQPLPHPRHDAPRLIKMFQHIEAGDYVERFVGKIRIQDMSHKHLRASLRLRDFRAIRGHLYTVQLPSLALQRFQERSRTAP